MNTDCQTCLPVTKVLNRTLPANSRQFVIEQKALAYRLHETRPLMQLQTKGVRAIWDPNVGPSGGWRCPEGTRYGGRITDRFGRLCGGGIIRRVGRGLMRVGRNLDEFGERQDRRRLERAANRRGRARRGAERVAMAQERMARRLVGSWQPGDGGRRTRRNLQGGPTQRTSMVSRAPTKRRSVKPEMEKPQRSRGQTPLSQPLKDRTSRSLPALSERTPDQGGTSRRRGSLSDVPTPPTQTPSIGERDETNPPVPNLETDGRNTLDTSSDERVQDIIGPFVFGRVMESEYNLQQASPGDRINRSMLNDRQRVALAAVMKDIEAQIINDYMDSLKLSSVPSYEELYDMLNLQPSRVAERRRMAQLWVAQNHTDIKFPYISSLWNSSQQRSIRDAIDNNEGRPLSVRPRVSAPSTQDGPRDFWSLRRREKQRQQPDDSLAPLDDNIFQFDDSYERMLKRLSGNQLEELQGQLEAMIEMADESTPSRAYMKKRWEKGLAQVKQRVEANRERNERLQQKFVDQAEVVKPFDNPNPRIIPALAPRNQRQQHNELLAPEDFYDGQIALPNRIVNDDITSWEEATAALNAGVPLHKVPQKYWYRALREHMFGGGDHKRQYVARAKNGGICKDGDRGDLMILEKLDENGNATGTGVVIGWEGWEGGMGKNGMENNIGEFIGWNLANALGLPAEPARFDGVFHDDDEWETPGIGFAIPFAWNRAPVGKVKQRNSGSDLYGANFEPRVVQNLPDEGYPQRLANVLYSALLGVPDRHDQNVMGGLVDGQAFVVPMDLGWGGQEEWDIYEYLDGAFNYEDSLISEIGLHLRDLRDGVDPDAFEPQAKAVAQVLDGMIARAQAIVDRGQEEFTERVVRALYLSDYDDLPYNVRADIEILAEETARKWFDALSFNLSNLSDIRDEVVTNWGLDADVNYDDATATTGIPRPNMPANPEPQPFDAGGQVVNYLSQILDSQDSPGSVFNERAEAFAERARQNGIRMFANDPAGNPVYVIRLKKMDEYLHLNEDEMRQLKDAIYENNENNFPSETRNVYFSEEIELVDLITDIRYGDVDPTDADLLERLVARKFPGADFAFFEQQVASITENFADSENMRQAVALRIGETPLSTDNWDIVDALGDEIRETFLDATVNRYAANAEVIAFARAFALAKARERLIEKLRGNMVDRPIRPINDAEWVYGRTAQVLPGLRPGIIRSQARFALADVGYLEPGQLVVPKPILNQNINNLADALNAFNAGASLETIPERFWFQVLDDHTSLLSPEEGARYGVLSVNEGAIKQVVFFAPIGSDGKMVDDAGILFVRDDENEQDFMGELLTWNVFGALGLNIGPARLVGAEPHHGNEGRWVALPHALNYGVRGTALTPDDDDVTDDMTNWGIKANEVNFNPVFFNRVADNGGVKNRIVAFLSQFMVGLPDRHFNNAKGRVVRTPNGRAIGEVNPIDLGWAGHELYETLKEYKGEDLFYDPTLLSDIKSQLGRINNKEEREKFARELVSLVDGLIERQRAIIRRGRQKFVKDAVASVTLPSGAGTAAMENLLLRRNAMRRKAEQVFTALDYHYRKLRDSEYEYLLKEMGIFEILGQVPFPEFKSFNIAFYSSKRLSELSQHAETKRLLIGAHNG